MGFKSLREFLELVEKFDGFLLEGGENGFFFCGRFFGFKYSLNVFMFRFFLKGVLFMG